MGNTSQPPFVSGLFMIIPVITADCPRAVRLRKRHRADSLPHRWEWLFSRIWNKFRDSPRYRRCQMPHRSGMSPMISMPCAIGIGMQTDPTVSGIHTAGNGKNPFPFSASCFRFFQGFRFPVPVSIRSTLAKLLPPCLSLIAI